MGPALLSIVTADSDGLFNVCYSSNVAPKVLPMASGLSSAAMLSPMSDFGMYRCKLLYEIVRLELFQTINYCVYCLKHVDLINDAKLIIDVPKPRCFLTQHGGGGGPGVIVIFLLMRINGQRLLCWLVCDGTHQLRSILHFVLMCL
jgi:hypothetical protein